jgi:hypothetical protein
MTHSGERFLPSQRVKKIFRESFDESSEFLTGSASRLLTEVASEFLHVIALASLDRSERRHQYIDSSGVGQALVDMGFEDIAASLPDLAGFTEDLQRK